MNLENNYSVSELIKSKNPNTITDILKNPEVDNQSIDNQQTARKVGVRNDMKVIYMPYDWNGKKIDIQISQNKEQLNIVTYRNDIIVAKENYTKTRSIKEFDIIIEQILDIFVEDPNRIKVSQKIEQVFKFGKLQNLITENNIIVGLKEQYINFPIKLVFGDGRYESNFDVKIKKIDSKNIQITIDASGDGPYNDINVKLPLNQLDQLIEKYFEPISQGDNSFLIDRVLQKTSVSKRILGLM